MTVDNANRNIPVHISSRVNRLGHGHHKGSNAFNLKNVARQEPIAHTLKQLSSFLSTNVRSLLPKIDELVLLWSHNLNDDIDDDLVSIRGYNLFRKDRSYRRGGRICVYLSQDIPVKRMIIWKVTILSVCGFVYVLYPSPQTIFEYCGMRCIPSTWITRARPSSL